MKRLRVLFVSAVLEMGVLVGAPMRPDEIQELMHHNESAEVGARSSE